MNMNTYQVTVTLADGTTREMEYLEGEDVLTMPDYIGRVIAKYKGVETILIKVVDGTPEFRKPLTDVEKSWLINCSGRMLRSTVNSQAILKENGSTSYDVILHEAARDELTIRENRR